MCKDFNDAVELSKPIVSTAEYSEVISLTNEQFTKQQQILREINKNLGAIARELKLIGKFIREK